MSGKNRFLPAETQPWLCDVAMPWPSSRISDTVTLASSWREPTQTNWVLSKFSHSQFDAIHVSSSSMQVISRLASVAHSCVFTVKVRLSVISVRVRRDTMMLSNIRDISAVKQKQYGS